MGLITHCGVLLYMKIPYIPVRCVLVKKKIIKTMTTKKTHCLGVPVSAPHHSYLL